METLAALLVFVVLTVTLILILKANKASKERSRKQTEADQQRALQNVTFTVTVMRPDPEPEATLTAEDRDAFEGWMDWERSIPAKANIHIVYTDARGATTERTVTTSRVNAGMILGYCHLRNANRTFLFGRIQRMIDTSTGEVIQDGWAYLKGIYDRTPAGQADEALTRLDDEVAVLLFMAKADGRMLAPERREIQAFLRAKATDLVIDPEAIDARIKRMSSPTLEEFRALAKHLAHADLGDRTALLAAATSIVQTQKHVDPMEQAALHVLEEAFAIPKESQSETAVAGTMA